MAKSTELTWRDTRGQMVAVPTTNRVGFRGQIELSQRLARFSARVGINNYLGADCYPPSVWVIDPLRGRPNWKRLRVRLANIATGGHLPSGLFVTRNTRPRK